MILLTAEKISKNYGIRPLIDHLSLTVSEGDKIGIIGVNGTGKTTLLKMLAGIEPPDGGEISRSSALRVGYLPQNPVFEENAPVLRQA
ncbi:MAG TPA: ABC transporter, partial [Ruminococcaceae bacterium]|nr:ABC transporter [Oscillospiraceae bacterium]